MAPPRVITLAPAAARIVRQGQRLLLRAEAALLRALDAAAARALADLLRLLDAAPDPERTKLLVLSASRRVADRLRVELAAAVVQARGQARRAALERVSAEFAAAVGHPLPAPTPSDAAEDHPLAEAAAESYTAAWRTGVTAATLAWADDPQGSLAPRLRDAARAQGHRLRRIAATEVPAAYSDEHQEAAEQVAKRHPELALLLIRVWDASLDRRTCPVCARMHGRWALLFRPFAGGLEPGQVHPYCRCTPVLLALKPGVLLPGSVYTGAALAA